MTAADWIDDLERKAKAATPGPWSADGYGGGQQVTGATGTIFADTLALHEDAEFIAAANPTTILRLILELQVAERKARRFAYDLRITEAVSDQRAARLAAVEALADEWDKSDETHEWILAADLRAALTGVPADTLRAVLTEVTAEENDR